VKTSKVVPPACEGADRWPDDRHRELMFRAGDNLPWMEMDVHNLKYIVGSLHAGWKSPYEFLGIQP